MNPLRTLMALLLAVPLAGCMQGVRDIPFLTAPETDAVAPQPDPAAPASESERMDAYHRGYTFTELGLDEALQASPTRFGVDDTLKIMVWGHPELTHTPTVQANGHITVPLAGEVKAAGRTAEEVRLDIEERLRVLAMPEGEQTLRYGDVVALYVWQNLDLNYKAVVQPDGSVTLPLVGRMEVVDRDLAEVQREVRTRMSRFIRDPEAWLIPETGQRKVIQAPRVSVLPLKLKDRQLAVLGEVRISGLQPVTVGKRVLDALAMSQTTHEADLNSVVIIRNPDSAEPQYRRLRIQDYLDGRAPNQNIFLAQNDVLIVPRTHIAQVALYVDHFFARTKPIFDWWLAAQQAVHYNDLRRLNEEALRSAIRVWDANIDPLP